MKGVRKLHVDRARCRAGWRRRPAVPSPLKASERGLMPTSISDSVRPAADVHDRDRIVVLVGDPDEARVGGVDRHAGHLGVLRRAREGESRKAEETEERPHGGDLLFPMVLGAGPSPTRAGDRRVGEPGQKSLTYLRYMASAGFGGPSTGRKAAPRPTRSSPQPGSKGVRLLDSQHMTGRSCCPPRASLPTHGSLSGSPLSGQLRAGGPNSVEGNELTRCGARLAPALLPGWQRWRHPISVPWKQGVGRSARSGLPRFPRG